MPLDASANDRAEKGEVCRVYIRRMNAMKLEFTFRSVQSVVEETALLESGASENFQDEEVWKGLGIGRVRLKQPIPVHNVDGTENRSGRTKYHR